MRILLDTQAWLWMQVSPERFSIEARTVIEDSASELYLSAASSWEIAIKYALGRLALPAPPAEYVPSRMERSGVTPLPVEHVHALHVSELPLHHRDPFDRVLVAQALLERLTVLTSDPRFDDYEVAVRRAD
ncbi:MAG: type II toxin-antitoxin system VapC family toxin [Actinomycetota bacterium]|nr:type II toxin-antitoxin system VapC family toxin [Actinomycetota bacterium]